MFDFFKTNKKKTLEILSENKELIGEINKRFYYRPDPNLIYQFLYDQARFLFSCQGLKNYFSSNVTQQQYTLQIESIVLIAKIADLLIPDLDNKYYHHYYFFESIFNLFNSKIKTYHNECICRIIDDQIYLNNYPGEHPETIISDYLNRVSSITQKNEWNYLIDGVCKENLRMFFSFISENEKRIIKAGESGIYNETSKFDLHKSESLTKNTEREFIPDISVYGLVSKISDEIDVYLLNKLGFNLSEIDVDFYSDKAMYDYNKLENPELIIFRKTIEKITTVENGKYKQDELKLKRGAILLSGVDVKNFINCLVQEVGMKKHLKYIL